MAKEENAVEVNVNDAENEEVRIFSPAAVATVYGGEILTCFQNILSKSHTTNPFIEKVEYLVRESDEYLKTYAKMHIDPRKFSTLKGKSPFGELREVCTLLDVYNFGKAVYDMWEKSLEAGFLVIFNRPEKESVTGAISKAERAERAEKLLAGKIELTEIVKTAESDK